MRVLVRLISIPSLVYNFLAFPGLGNVGVNSQAISIGISPLFTVHMVDTMSNWLIWSSPNPNGTICGRTVCDHMNKRKLFHAFYLSFPTNTNNISYS